MIETLDINEEIRKVLSNKIDSIIKNIDIGSIILARIDEYVSDRATNSRLQHGLISHKRIDWTDFVLPPESIGSGIINNFTSAGIEDRAGDVNLTILDGQVIIENETITKQLTVVENASIKSLTVGDIVIGNSVTIRDSKFTEQIKSLIDTQIAQHAVNNNLDLNGKPLVSNRVTLLDNHSLGSTIIESNLRKLGRLNNLTVAGETNLADTVYINNGKLGINTDEPAGAITIWDEESELTVKKYKNRTMYIGSSRDSDLVLGVGGNAVLAVRQNGVETNRIKVGNINITSSLTEPSHKSSPGDLVINENTKPGDPWAWRCSGGNNWLPLK